MTTTSPFDGACPVCAAHMDVTRFTCARCGTSLEGRFLLQDSAASDAERYGRLARLDAAQLQFVEVFVRNRGIIKNVEDVLGISYPTVRARLNSVIAAMGFRPDDESPSPERRQEMRDILTQLTEGKLSVQDAHDRLRAVSGSTESE